MSQFLEVTGQIRRTSFAGAKRGLRFDDSSKISWVKKSLRPPNSQNLGIQNVLKIKKVVYMASWRDSMFPNFAAKSF